MLYLLQYLTRMCVTRTSVGLVVVQRGHLNTADIHQYAFLRHDANSSSTIATMASFSSPDRGPNLEQAPLAALSARNYSRPTTSSASLDPIHPRSSSRNSRHVVLEPRPHKKYPDFLTSRGKATTSHHDENMCSGTALALELGREDPVNRADPYCVSKEKASTSSSFLPSGIQSTHHESGRYSLANHNASQIKADAQRSSSRLIAHWRANKRQGETEASDRSYHNALTTTTQNQLKARKTKFNLRNPISLLLRRRSNKSGMMLSSGHSATAPVMRLPEDYDPRIRGPGVHDFSAPRARCIYPNGETLTSKDVAIVSTKPAPPLKYDEIMNKGLPLRATLIDGFNKKIAQAETIPTSDPGIAIPLSGESRPYLDHDWPFEVKADPVSTRIPSLENDPAMHHSDDISRHESLTQDHSINEATSTNAFLQRQISARSHSVEATSENLDGRSGSPTSSKDAPRQQGSISRHMKRVAPRFSFDLGGVGSSAQEQLLEENHRRLTENQESKPLTRQLDANAERSESEEDDASDYHFDDGSIYEEDVPEIGVDITDRQEDIGDSLIGVDLSGSVGQGMPLQKGKFLDDPKDIPLDSCHQSIDQQLYEMTVQNVEPSSLSQPVSATMRAGHSNLGDALAKESQDLIASTSDDTLHVHQSLLEDAQSSRLGTLLPVSQGRNGYNANAEENLAAPISALPFIHPGYAGRKEPGLVVHNAESAQFPREASIRIDLAAIRDDFVGKPANSFEENDDDDDATNNDAIIAAANAEALASDSEGIYGQEFGFYASPSCASQEASALGGYFDPRGFNMFLKINKGGNAALAEPNLTPITERSEYSTRNSFIWPRLSATQSAHSLHGSGLLQQPPGLTESSPDAISLPDIYRFGRHAWAGSSGSLHSVDSFGSQARGYSPSRSLGPASAGMPIPSGLGHSTSLPTSAEDESGKRNQSEVEGGSGIIDNDCDDDDDGDGDDKQSAPPSPTLRSFHIYALDE